jgi:hypothetical protein
MPLRVATRRLITVCNGNGPSRVATRRNASAMAVPTSSQPEQTYCDISVRIPPICIKTKHVPAPSTESDTERSHFTDS